MERFCYWCASVALACLFAHFVDGERARFGLLCFLIMYNAAHFHLEGKDSSD